MLFAFGEKFLAAFSSLNSLSNDASTLLLKKERLKDAFAFYSLFLNESSMKLLLSSLLDYWSNSPIP